MSYDKIAYIVESFIVNTNNGKIKWKESTLQHNAFEYSFTHSTIVICQDRCEDNDVCIFLTIFNDEGKVIESVSDVDLVQYFEKPYQELFALFNTAR